MIESRQTLPLQRRTRRKENDNRNGIQEYSIASYIKHWIDLGKESPKPKRTTPQFSFDKMHRYIIQFAVCSDMKCRKLDEVYGQNRVLLEKAGQVLEQVFLYYNYDSAVTSISQFIQDIHNFYWAYLDEHVGIKITIPIP